MPDLPSARELVRNYQSRTKKSLGQHFLVDERALEQIADAAQLEPGARVLEIGPGAGSLSQALLRREVRLRAVEKDAVAASYLREVFAQSPTFELVEGDALEIPLEAVEQPWIVVANLPYNVSTPIWFALTEQRVRIRRTVLMFQREVAQRFVAVPNTKAYGTLSVFAQRYYQVRYLMTVPPGAFRPIPKVHSSVLVFEPRPEVHAAREPELHEVVRAAFNQRRKTLHNALCGLRGATKEQVAALLARAGLDPMLRAEALSVDDFVRLAGLLAGLGSPDR